jgi:PAS domain S-box-containing protein
MSDNAARQRRLTHTPFLSSDELITLLEENVKDYAIIFTDPENRIINWSRGAEHIFGFSVEEALGKDVALIYTPEDQAQGILEREYRKAAENGRAVNERYHVKKDGSLFWGSGILTALRGSDGCVRGAVKILRDLTVQKQMEESLRQQTETAQEERRRAEQERERAETSAREVAHLNMLLRRAMAEAHHRIKNSFQMLSALLEVQNENDAENDTRRDYKKFALHIQALSAIHDLLTEEVKTAGEFETLSARTLLERLLQLTQATLPDRTIQVEIEDLPLSLKQGTSLAPLVNEIITNAVKHGRGDIHVKFQRQNSAACLEICNQGAGFPADFDPQQAAHTGLELIETLTQHDLGGEVRYDNIAVGRARVTVIFPVITA